MASDALDRSEAGALDVITFAVVSSAVDAERPLAVLCGQLERGLSRRVEPRVLPSYDALRDEVAAGRAHVVWAPPLVAIELEDAGHATIDLCCTRGGQADYHAALFTRHASPVDTIADLEGTHAAWVDLHSSAGYLLPRMRLLADGQKLEGLFSRESFLGTHEKVACAVLAGEADVGATYLILDPRTKRPLSAGWLEAGAGINGAHIVATAGPIPSDAIVLSKRLGAKLERAIADRLSSLADSHPDPVGRLFHADGFKQADRSHFDALRALSAGHLKEG